MLPRVAGAGLPGESGQTSLERGDGLVQVACGKGDHPLHERGLAGIFPGHHDARRAALLERVGHEQGARDRPDLPLSPTSPRNPTSLTSPSLAADPHSR